MINIKTLKKNLWGFFGGTWKQGKKEFFESNQSSSLP